MKKIISIILIIISFTSLLSACDNSNNNDEYNSDVMNYYYNDDFYFEYKTDYYKFRLPKFWENKFTVINTLNKEAFYEINSFETDETGLLFEIYTYDDESYKKDLENYEYLCYDERFEKHYIMIIPQNPEFSEDYAENYSELQEGIKVAKLTFEAER